jgi:hypothetical protein
MVVVRYTDQRHGDNGKGKGTAKRVKVWDDDPSDSETEEVYESAFNFVASVCELMLYSCHTGICKCNTS